MRKLYRCPAVVLPMLVVLLTACGRSGDRDDDMAADTVGLFESAEHTQELLAPVRAAGLLIIEHGQLAARQASRQDVREFSETAATDHRAIVGVLDSVAGTRGATLTETERARELAHTIRMAHAGLDNTTPENFDLSFVRAQVESHRQLLDLLDQELIPTASSPQLQTLMDDVRGTVDAHLTRARQLLGALLGEPVEPPPDATEPSAAPQTPPAQPPVRTVPDTIPPGL